MDLSGYVFYDLPIAVTQAYLRITNGNNRNGKDPNNLRGDWLWVRYREVRTSCVRTQGPSTTVRDRRDSRTDKIPEAKTLRNGRTKHVPVTMIKFRNGQPGASVTEN